MPVSLSHSLNGKRPSKTGVGIAATAVGVGVYWANRGLKATADNIGAAADGIKAAHERHEQKKAAKAIANAAIAEAVNQGV